MSPRDRSRVSSSRSRARHAEAHALGWLRAGRRNARRMRTSAQRRWPTSTPHARRCSWKRSPSPGADAASRAVHVQTPCRIRLAVSARGWRLDDDRFVRVDHGGVAALQLLDRPVLSSHRILAGLVTPRPDGTRTRPRALSSVAVRASVLAAATTRATIMPESTWWQHGIITRSYPRSFQDTNGDGIGDLRRHPRAPRLSRRAGRRRDLDLADLPIADGGLRL